jgi:predicted nucleic acid-binding protein
MPDEQRVWVFDTSALIDFKRQIPAGVQWQAFKRLEELVASGQIAMPRQVIREIERTAHPDLPGAWAPGVRGALRHPLDVEFEHLRRVMAKAGQVVDPNKTEEDADPYVAALALQLASQGLDPVVVTTDAVDHLPIRIALTTACDRVGLRHTDSRAFLVAVGILVKPKP